MGKKNNNHQFSSYKKKNKYEKLNNPQRADWSGLLRELRGESSKKKKEQITTMSNKEANNS